MSDDDSTQLDQIQTSVEALARGLTLMNETLGTHSEMLAEILQAATREVEDENPLTQTLEKIFVTLKTQTDVLVQIGGMLDKLGPTIEQAVIRGVHRAAGIVDEDGIIEE